MAETNIKELLNRMDGFKVKRSGKDPQELTELIRTAKTATSRRIKDKCRTKLVEIYRPSVVGQARGYIKRGTAGKGVRVAPRSIHMSQIQDDIVNAAWEGFFRALELYDPDSGVPFGGYFRFHVQHRCTKEFYTQTSHISGTDNKVWREFLKWCGQQKRSKTALMEWEDVIEEAAQAIGCEPIEIEDIIKTRTYGVGSWEQNSTTCSEGGGETEVPCSVVEDDSYEWAQSNSLRRPDKPTSSEMWLEIESLVTQEAKRGKKASEVARVVAERFDADCDAKTIEGNRAFREAYRAAVPVASSKRKRKRKATKTTSKARKPTQGKRIVKVGK